MRTLAGVAVFVVLTACVTGSPNAGQDGENPNLLTREQILEPGLMDLYEVVNRLRPNWGRGGMGSVCVDGIRMGTYSYLRGLPPTTAYDMEYLDEFEAKTRIPSLSVEQAKGGVILIRTRPGGGN